MNEVVPVRSNNDEMRQAMDAARASLGQFLRAFNNPMPNQEKFLVKIFFVHNDQVEHIWMEHLDLSTTPYTGAIANEPRLPSLSFGQRKSFVADRITDWMYFEDGKLVGGYTTRVLLKQQMERKRGGLKRGGLKRLLGSLREAAIKPVGLNPERQ